MPIVTIQRRMMELGRIRLGDKGPKGEPRKLSKFRLTSASKALLDAAAISYGGEVRPWTGAPDEGYFELYTETDKLDIVLPPVYSAADGSATFSWSQWFELWSGGGCQRRCDGETEMLSGKPCLCRSEWLTEVGGEDPGGEMPFDDRACKMTTRVNMILPALPGVGVWRLESHGYNAAVLLPGTLDLLQRAASEGQFIPAVLRIDQQSRKIPGEGTLRYVVPVIDMPEVRMAELPGVLGPMAINAPVVNRERPALPISGPEPSTEKFENDTTPEWGEDAPLPTLEVTEVGRLTVELAELADQLGVGKSTVDAIKANHDKHADDPDKHLMWLRDQITRARKALNEREGTA